MKLYLSQERLSRFRRSFCYLILLSPQFYYIICYGQRGLFFSPNLYYLFINNKYFQTTIPINTWSPQKKQTNPNWKNQTIKKSIPLLYSSHLSILIILWDFLWVFWLLLLFLNICVISCLSLSNYFNLEFICFSIPILSW